MDFYLLKRNGSKHCAPQNNVDAWGNVIAIGTFYIDDIFYERVDENEYVFKLLEDSPTNHKHLLSFLGINNGFGFSLTGSPN